MGAHTQASTALDSYMPYSFLPLAADHQISQDILYLHKQQPITTDLTRRINTTRWWSPSKVRVPYPALPRPDHMPDPLYILPILCPHYPAYADILSSYIHAVLYLLLTYIPPSTILSLFRWLTPRLAPRLARRLLNLRGRKRK